MNIINVTVRYLLDCAVHCIQLCSTPVSVMMQSKELVAAVKMFQKRLTINKYDLKLNI